MLAGFTVYKRATCGLMLSTSRNSGTLPVRRSDSVSQDLRQKGTTGKVIRDLGMKRISKSFNNYNLIISNQSCIKVKFTNVVKWTDVPGKALAMDTKLHRLDKHQESA